MTNREAAVKIIRVLRRQGHEALLAGGCVRDMLLSRIPKDYDVVTSAAPHEVGRLFQRTLKVGARFGVMIVLMDDQRVEVATFRADMDYVDGRRPTSVTFTSAKEDALRRDFTVNGMFYDPIARQVIDYVGGRSDLARGIIRTIGNPGDRFGEDYLRLLRAVRFATQLGFAIEPATYKAIGEQASKIGRISGERICMELEGLLTVPGRAQGVRYLVDTGLARQIFPGLSAEQTALGIAVLERVRPRTNFPLVLAALFVDCQADRAREQLGILKLSRHQSRHVKFLLEHRDHLLDDSLSIARLKLLLAGPFFWDLYELQRALLKARGQGLGPLIRLRRRIRKLGDIDYKPVPLLNGHDLISLGAQPGPRLGQLIEELYIAQLEGQVHTRAQAEKWAHQWLDRHNLDE